MKTLHNSVMNSDRNLDVQQLLTPQELAACLKISLGTIYYWTSRNEIPFIKLGKHLRFCLKTVIEFFEQKRIVSEHTCPPFRGSLKDPYTCSLKTKNANPAELRKKE